MSHCHCEPIKLLWICERFFTERVRVTNGKEALLSFHLVAVRSGHRLQPFVFLPRGGIPPDSAY